MGVLKSKVDKLDNSEEKISCLELSIISVLITISHERLSLLIIPCVIFFYLI